MHWRLIYSFFAPRGMQCDSLRVASLALHAERRFNVFRQVLHDQQQPAAPPAVYEYSGSRSFAALLLVGLWFWYESQPSFVETSACPRRPRDQWQRRAHEHLAHRPQGQLLALLLDDAHAERARRLAAEETHEGFVFVNTRVAHGAPIARRPATWQQGSTRVHGGGGGALSDGIRSCRRVGPASAGVARPPARTVDAHRCARGCCR